MANHLGLYTRPSRDWKSIAESTALLHFWDKSIRSHSECSKKSFRGWGSKRERPNLTSSSYFHFLHLVIISWGTNSGSCFAHTSMAVPHLFCSRTPPHGAFYLCFLSPAPFATALTWRHRSFCVQDDILCCMSKIAQMYYCLWIHTGADFSSSQKWKMALDFFPARHHDIAKKTTAAEDLNCVATLVVVLKKNKCRTVVVCNYNCISFTS